MPIYGVKNHNGGIHLMNKKNKTESRGHYSKPTVPDEVILEMRRKHEIDRIPTTKIMELYPQHSKKYIRDILGYILRAHLIPK
jgi:hypothetical protein